MQASFIAHPGVTSLLGEDTGSQNPWFGKEAALKPRDAVVPSLGYTFVSADYSQVRYCCFFVCLGNGTHVHTPDNSTIF